LTLFREVVNSGISSHIAIETVTAAVVYAACRIEHMPRTLQEISVLSGVNKSAINKFFYKIVSTIGVNTERVLPVHFVLRISTLVGLEYSIAENARTLSEKVSAIGVVDGVPANAVAAAIVLLFCICSEQIERVGLIPAGAFSSAAMIRETFSRINEVIGQLSSSLNLSSKVNLLKLSDNDHVKSVLDMLSSGEARIRGRNMTEVHSNGESLTDLTVCKSDATSDSNSTRRKQLSISANNSPSIANNNSVIMQVIKGNTADTFPPNVTGKRFNTNSSGSWFSSKRSLI